MHAIISSNSWHDFERSLAYLGGAEKGRAFEELTRLHLLTDPVFSTKIGEIWHHSEVPQSIIDDLGLQQPEIGVDLIARCKDGTYWAIQCKFHQDRTKNVSYSELSTFFSITERQRTYSKLSHRIISTSANSVSHKIDKAHPDKLGYLTGGEFSRLKQSDFDAFRNILAGQSTVWQPYEPREHQQRALRNADAYFVGNNNRRGKIIHPCGSGKSLTGYWIAHGLKAKMVLIAVPSLALVRQTLGVWTREAVANGRKMDWIAVCSDEGVSKSDNPAMRTFELGIKVTTDVEEISKFLASDAEEIKVVITTYQSGHVVSASSKDSGTCFDIGIYDEAHKTVGRRDKTFAHLLYDENVAVNKRVFMTATERVFKGNSEEIVSMDDECIYGRVIDEMSFKQAIDQTPAILCDYKIISTTVTKADIQQLIDDNEFIKSSGDNWSFESDSSTFAALIALQKLVESRGIRHVISFHRSISRAKQFMELNAEVTSVNGLSGSISAFHVSGKDSTAERAAQLERFVNVEPSLITNSRCLTEGVDVPGVDAVLFADPKQSKIDIVQAAGRALRISDGKSLGYIIVPTVIDENDVDPLGNVFAAIISVISALGMSDERIIEEFKNLVAGKQSQGRIVEFDIPAAVKFINVEEFVSSIQIRVWDRLSFAESVVGENEFARWMRESKGLSEKTIKNYRQAVRKISNDLVRLKLAYSSLEELLCVEDLDALKDEYFSIPEYAELDKRGKSMYSAGFNRLIEYHRSTHPAE